MDRGPGTASGGSFISISENEQRCFSGLSTLCQADSSGKLAASKVGELFRASQLPAETLHQVSAAFCRASRSVRSNSNLRTCVVLLGNTFRSRKVHEDHR